MPATFLAYSMTAICIPRQMPKYGALDPALTEAARDDDTVSLAEDIIDVLRSDTFRVDPLDFDRRALIVTCVTERFGYAEISVVQFDILADKADLDDSLARFDALDHMLPVAQIRLVRFQIQLAAYDVGEVRLFKHQGRFIQYGQGEILDHAVRPNVAEAGDLIENSLVGDRFIGTKDDDIGRHAEALQFFDGVLGRLAFMLAGGFEIRHEGHMDIQAVVLAYLVTNLSDRLDEGLALDIADRAADLGDDDVCISFFADAVDEALDLVRDMRDHLYRLAEILAVTLLVEHV